MLSKLAIRNVRRQMSSYLIYFLTVMLTIAMMFALCNLTFSEQLMQYASRMENLKNSLITISVFVAVIVSCVLGYATSFMLKMRKREFGTYLTLGMTRKDILILFCVENLLIGLIALIMGLLFGLFIFQGLIQIVGYVLDIRISLAAYSLTGLLLTVILSCSIFIISTLVSIFHLNRVSIYELLHAKEKVNRIIKHPFVWFAFTILSLLGIVLSIVGTDDMLKNIFLNTTQDEMYTTRFFTYILLLIVFVMTFHVGLSKCLPYVFMKSERLKSRGTNTFLLRQLSGQLGTNAVMCGIIAALITSSIIGTNVCFGQKSSINHGLDQSYPFDIQVNLTKQQMEGDVQYDDAKKVINRYSDISSEERYSIYTSDRNDLYQRTLWGKDNLSGLNDCYIKVSDFNMLMKSLGKQTIQLNQEYMILAQTTQMMGSDFNGYSLSLNGKDYSYKEMSNQYPILSYEYFLAVVPDEAVAGMNTEVDYAVLQLKTKHYNAEQLRSELTYVKQNSQGYNIERCNFKLREYSRLDENSLAAILVVGAMYISIVFIFLAVAILTLKLLAGIADDRKRYNVLYRLGVSYEDRKKTLFMQILIYFTIPFFIPILLSIPVAYACGQLVEYGGYLSLISQMYTNAFIIALALFATQLLYFTATYIVEKRQILSLDK